MSNISKLLSKNELYSPIISLSSSIAEDLKMDVYLVGGFVRDLLLKKKLIDIDIMVEGNAEKFARELSKRLKINKVVEFEKFHTYRIPYNDYEIDVAEARKETYESNSRKPNTVTSASISEDLGRRDFTVNALAISLNKDNYGEIIDTFNEAQCGDRSQLLNYFIQSRLKELTESIGDF